MLPSSLSDFAKRDTSQAGRALFFVLARPSKEIDTPKNVYKSKNSAIKTENPTG
jgi:hypothetical protein